MNKFHNENTTYIKSVTLMVKDIEKSLEFYTKNIGLEIISKENDTYSLGVLDNVLVILISNPSAKAKTRTTGLYHFALLLPNEKFLGQLIKYFITTEQKIIGGSDHAVSQALYLSDPDGNGIEIYADRSDEEWQYDEENQVVMITDEMNYGELIRNAYEESFEHMPNNTIMGHVHFHVSNLLNASKFFIDVVGLDVTTTYGDNALFLSSDNYHHHVGMNTWNGVGIENRPEDMVGLVSYNLNVANSKRSELVERLKDNHIEILKENNKEYFYDINKVKVFF